MPPAEAHIDAALIRRQLQRIDPALARLPLSYLATGWDNEVYRLGGELLVRAPRRQMGERLGRTERRWLPVLQRATGLEVGVELCHGEPNEEYPFTLSVCRYLPGISAVELTRRQRDGYADDFTSYLKRLHVPAPPAAPRSVLRGRPLRELDLDTRKRFDRLAVRCHPAAERIWEAALEAPGFTGAPRWLHGDPHPHNTIVAAHDGGARGLAGLVDFGDLCAGDPASDLGMLWLHFTYKARERSLAAYGVQLGGALWQRARGWALRYCLILHTLDSTDRLGRIGRETLQILLGEAG